MKKQYLCIFLSAILAGVMIGIGGTVYLNLTANGNKIAGALLFAVGLFTIIVFKLHLYTGKVGYLFIPDERAKSKITPLVLTILGNMVGTFAMGFAFSQRLVANTGVFNMVQDKLNLPLWDAFLLAIPCGILMYVAVEGHKTAESDVVKGIIVLFSVAVFILSGFEHSVADMFYVAASGVIGLKAVVFIAVVILGNAAGGIGFSVLTHYINKNLGGK